MVSSYNGFKASKNSADFGGLDNTPIQGTDVTFAPGFRAGDVGFVMREFFWEFDRRVEKLVKGWCWGYYYKPSANSASLLSCHSSATAGDANAPKHPNGKRGTFSQAQVAEIRKLLAEFDGLIYWGGDAWGNGTPDEMHFEIKTGVMLEQISALAAKRRAAKSAPTAPAKGASRPTPPAHKEDDVMYITCDKLKVSGLLSGGILIGFASPGEYASMNDNINKGLVARQYVEDYTWQAIDRRSKLLTGEIKLPAETKPTA